VLEVTQLPGNRPAKGGAVHVERRGYVLAAFTFVDQLSGVVNLLHDVLHRIMAMHYSVFA
jgi:hypothetical protein